MIKFKKLIWFYFLVVLTNSCLSPDKKEPDWSFAFGNVTSIKFYTVPENINPSDNIRHINRATKNPKIFKNRSDVMEIELLHSIDELVVTSFYNFEKKPSDHIIVGINSICEIEFANEPSLTFVFDKWGTLEINGYLYSYDGEKILKQLIRTARKEFHNNFSSSLQDSP